MSRSTRLPVVEPMHPWRAREPFHRPGWIYERKEGRVADARVQGRRRVRLVSRRGVDHTTRFAELAAAIAQLPARTLVLDGEVCVFDADRISQFHLLGDEQHGEVATPPVFVAFDAVFARGRDLAARPLRERRAVLENEIADARLVFPALRFASDGFDAWTEVKRCGWEGLVAKDDSSRYVGGRSRSWVKVKVRREGRFVVVGLDVAPRRSASLLLAARNARELVSVGRVEWGVTRGTAERSLVQRAAWKTLNDASHGA